VVTAPGPAADGHAVQVVGNPTAQSHMAATAQAAAPAAAAVRPSPGRKTRVVISQDPTPLYCSDECRARDLKNSFIESDNQGFAGASAARDRMAQSELVRQSVELSMRTRHALAKSQQGRHAEPDADADADADADTEPQVPPVPPNSFVDVAPLSRTTSLGTGPPPASLSSALLASASAPQLHVPAAKARPRLPRTASTVSSSGYGFASGSLAAWGSPAKAALAPPAHTLFNAGASSCSIDSHASSTSSAVSALFDDEAIVMPEKPASPGAETCATTPSRRGSGSSGEIAKKKPKRVSFASDAKPGSALESVAASCAVEQEGAQVSGHPQPAAEDWHKPRRRNPLLDANPIRDAASVSPKDRIKSASLPSDLRDAPADTPGLAVSRSTSALYSRVVDTPPPHRSAPYSVAMWPEDEKRTTESSRVHGELLRRYTKLFRPREGRCLVRGQLWEGSEADARYRAAAVPAWRGPGSAWHDRQPHSRREYWKMYEERQAEARALRKAAEEVDRMEEERVICELLGGAGMREKDQPQARRMKKMAYDGMPGPAEQRGLTYTFDKFLYAMPPPKPRIIEKKVRRFDEKNGEWIEETIREEVFERKKLFNFSED